MTRRSKIRVGLWTGVGAAAAVALYAIAWQTLADRWRDGIAAWTASLAASGGTAATGPMSVSGFPGPIRIALPAPALADGKGDAWTGPPMVVSIAPWAPLDPRFAAPGAHRIALAGHPPVTVTAETADGRVTVEGSRPVALDLTLAQASSGGLAVGTANIAAKRLAVSGTVGPETPVLGVTIATSDVTVPEGWAPALDPKLTHADLSLRLKGALAPGPLAQSLAAWRDAGGTVEIDALELAWPPLWANGNATLALDRDLQPELAGTFAIRGMTAAIDRAGANGLVPPAAAITAKLALGLTATQASDGAAENKLAVTVQDRVLSVGPVPLIVLPEVTW